MPNLHVTEFTGIASTDQSDSIVAFSADAVVAVQAPAIVAATNTVSAAFNAATQWIKVTAGAACSIAISAAPVAAAGGWFLNAGETILIRIAAAGQKIANFPDAL